tara:strand:- start:4360 stop:4557 length:198 start_codon:yes stop_codon:yes gene_type:complete
MLLYYSILIVLILFVYVKITKDYKTTPTKDYKYTPTSIELFGKHHLNIGNHRKNKLKLKKQLKQC